MKFARTLVALAIASMVSAPALAANSLTFQGVTFSSYAVDSDTLSLSILNATHATGNWTDVTRLSAFEIKGIGNVTNATIISGPGVLGGGSGYFIETDEHGLSAGVGCKTGGTPGACFFAVSPYVPLTDSMTWEIDFQGTNLDFSLPHLKVQFLVSQTQNKATGDLLSRELPVVTTPVPEPETYAMLLAGLGLMGLLARRRKNHPL